MPEPPADDDCRFTDDTVMTIACKEGIKTGLKKIGGKPYIDNTENQIEMINNNFEGGIVCCG